MNKETSKKVIFSLNTPQIIDALNHYADERINSLRNSLEVARDFDEVRRLQGGIDELKRLKHIRDYAIGVMEVEKEK